MCFSANNCFTQSADCTGMLFLHFHRKFLIDALLNFWTDHFYVYLKWCILPYCHFYKQLLGDVYACLLFNAYHMVFRVSIFNSHTSYTVKYKCIMYRVFTAFSRQLSSEKLLLEVLYNLSQKHPHTNSLGNNRIIKKTQDIKLIIQL